MDESGHAGGNGVGGNPDFTTVCKEFEKLIADAKSTKIATFFATKYARFHEKVRLHLLDKQSVSKTGLQIRKDQKMAEKIILDAIRRDAVRF